MPEELQRRTSEAVTMRPSGLNAVHLTLSRTIRFFEANTEIPFGFVIAVAGGVELPHYGVNAEGIMAVTASKLTKTVTKGLSRR